MSTGALTLPRIAVARRKGHRFRPHGAPRSSLAERLILALVTAGDVTTGMIDVVRMLRTRSRAAGVEWWAPSPAGDSFALEAVDGRTVGMRQTFSLGAAGALVVTEARWPGGLETALGRLAPVLRRRLAEERLAEKTVQLARRNEALEDFAALLAHELKTPLQLALQDPGASVELERALEIVDAILEAARADGDGASAAPLECLEEALGDLGPVPPALSVALPAELPFAATPLRVVLRNLIANAVAAGASTVRVAAAPSRSSWTLTVDDDGVGLGPQHPDDYAKGSGVGLSLCRRMVERTGGAFELSPLRTGGTRASVSLRKE